MLPSRRVLLVDDESTIVNCLRDQLEALPAAWQVQVATSGFEALARLDQDRFDVIVSDLRMPEMDGATLLKLASGRYPAMLRIVISGYLDRDEAVQSLQFAHQYLPKPCDGPALAEVMHRAMGQREGLSHPPLRELVGRVGALPSVPRMYAQLARIIANPDCSFDQIGDAIRQEPALTAKVLQFANSAYLGMRGTVSDPGQAAALLGTRVLRGLVLSAEVFTQFTPRTLISGFSPEAEQRHAVRVARLASALDPRAPWRDDAFSAGLLHDAGKLLLASRLGSGYASVLEEAQASGRPPDEIERLQLGADHAQVAGYLFGLWGLPEPIVQAVARHHLPPGRIETLDVASALRVANELARVPGPGALTAHVRREASRDPRWAEWAEIALRLEDEREVA